MPHKSNGTVGPGASKMHRVDIDATLAHHLKLLHVKDGLDELNEIQTAPIFTAAVKHHAESLDPSAGEEVFPQYGLLGGDTVSKDPRIFYNVAAPSSVFICGSQGSGKSHTLSCLLENCMIPSRANVLPRPLTGIVFHYDTFISDSHCSPCEVAYLATYGNMSVRVLCPPTNIATARRTYAKFPRVKVEELRIRETDLNTKRMLDLMAFSGSNTPLYLHVISRILRDMRIAQQRNGTKFNYEQFKTLIKDDELSEHQIGPLNQRLDTLESFMAPPSQTKLGTNWEPKRGQLTIVDLSCPCVTPETACSLFNICLSLFLEQGSSSSGGGSAVGRVVALDEAHKYMSESSSDSRALTEALLATIRLQRHLGARVFISTQEPTVSPKLLDLCSVTVVHRFSSPDWLRTLQRHLAGVSAASKLLRQVESSGDDGESGSESSDGEDGDDDDSGSEGGGGGVRPLELGSNDPALELFSWIVRLRVGEAFVFAPSAVIGVDGAGEVKRLGHGALKVRIRNRVTEDGGKSVLAV